MRIQAAHGTRGGGLADGFGAVQIGGAACQVIPIIALHTTFIGGHHTARNAVAAALLVRQKAVAVAIHILVMAGLYTGTFGILNAGVGRLRRGFALARQVHRFSHRQRPRMIRIGIAQIGGHQRGIGQPGIFVLRGVASDIGRCRYGVLQRLRRKIGGTGAPLGLAHIHSDVQRFVLLVFDLLDFLQPHLHRLAVGFAHIGLCRSGALLLGQIQHLAAQVLQFFGTMVKHGWLSSLGLCGLVLSAVF